MRYLGLFFLLSFSSIVAYGQMDLILESFMQEHRGKPVDYYYSSYDTFYIQSLDEMVYGLRTSITFEVKRAKKFDPGLFREDLTSFLAAYEFNKLKSGRHFAVFRYSQEDKREMYITSRFPEKPKDGVKFEIFEATDVSGEFVIKNSSFEGKPARGQGHHRMKTLIPGWKDCSYLNFPLQTSADISSRVQSAVQNPRSAAHGNTFVVLTGYDSGQTECISQELENNFKANAQYHLELEMARDSYMLEMHGLPKAISFNAPLGLTIYGGHDHCDKEYILFEFIAVKHQYWHTYEADFFMPDDCSHLTICAAQPDTNFVNGHLLLDNIHNTKEQKQEED